MYFVGGRPVGLIRALYEAMRGRVDVCMVVMPNDDAIAEMHKLFDPADIYH